jgi:5-formyltetrahydrofolate cyclo-ligase
LHIGLAFEAQIVKKIPVDAHDLPVHKIVTEKRVIDCRNQ